MDLVAQFLHDNYERRHDVNDRYRHIDLNSFRRARNIQPSSPPHQPGIHANAVVNPPSSTNQTINESAVAVQPPSPITNDAEIQAPSPPLQAANKADAETQADLPNDFPNKLPNDSITGPISLANSLNFQVTVDPNVDQPTANVEHPSMVSQFLNWFRRAK